MECSFICPCKMVGVDKPRPEKSAAAGGCEGQQDTNRGRTTLLDEDHLPNIQGAIIR